MKRTFVILLLMLLMLFPSCIRKKAATDYVAISLCHWENPEGTKLLEELVAGFEKRHPDIRVKLIQVTGGGGEIPKLLSMIAGGTPPDVFYITYPYFPTFVKKGVLLNLSPHIEKSEEIRIEDFFPLAIDSYRYNGEVIGEGDIYGICKDFSPDNCILYNKDLFDRDGLEYPDETWAWEDFLKAAKKLTKRDESGRTEQFGTWMPHMNDLLILANGGKIFSSDGKKCIVDTPEAVEAMEFGVSLETEHRVTPSPTERIDQDAIQLFQMGKVAMTFCSRYAIPATKLDKNKNIRWAVGPVPRFEGRERVYLCYSATGYAISAATRHKKEAWALFEFLLGEEGQSVLARSGWNIPASRKVAYSEAFLSNPEHPTGLNKIFLEQVPYTQMRNVNPNIPTEEFHRIWGRYEELVYLRKISVGEALESIVEETNKVIETNLSKDKYGG